MLKYLHQLTVLTVLLLIIVMAGPVSALETPYGDTPTGNSGWSTSQLLGIIATAVVSTVAMYEGGNLINDINDAYVYVKSSLSDAGDYIGSATMSAWESIQSLPVKQVTFADWLKKRQEICKRDGYCTIAHRI